MKVGRASRPSPGRPHLVGGDLRYTVILDRIRELGDMLRWVDTLGGRRRIGRIAVTTAVIASTRVTRASRASTRVDRSTVSSGMRARSSCQPPGRPIGAGGTVVRDSPELQRSGLTCDDTRSYGSHLPPSRGVVATRFGQFRRVQAVILRHALAICTTLTFRMSQPVCGWLPRVGLSRALCPWT
jgi:hypothetical protein